MDEIIEIYNKIANEYARNRVGTEDLAEIKKFTSLLKPGDRILDVGCAAGRDTRIFKDLAFDVVGADLADKLIEIAQKNNPDIKFVVADMRNLPFENGSFEAVWASAVLHYVNKDEMLKALKELWRIIAKDGFLYVRTKTGKGTLSTQESCVEGGARKFELVTPDELDEMMSSVGYEKISLDKKESRSREGLFWANAVYRKTS